jgi:hypothetical protein
MTTDPNRQPALETIVRDRYSAALLLVLTVLILCWLVTSHPILGVLAIVCAIIVTLIEVVKMYKVR